MKSTPELKKEWLLKFKILLPLLMPTKNQETKPLPTENTLKTKLKLLINTCNGSIKEDKISTPEEIT
jgi:hypothetical protein